MSYFLNAIVHDTRAAILLKNMGGKLGVKPIQSSGRCRSDVL